MECEIGTDAEAKRLVAAALEGQLTDEQAEVLAGETGDAPNQPVKQLALWY